MCLIERTRFQAKLSDDYLPTPLNVEEYSFAFVLVSVILSVCFLMRWSTRIISQCPLIKFDIISKIINRPWHSMLC